MEFEEIHVYDCSVWAAYPGVFNAARRAFNRLLLGQLDVYLRKRSIRLCAAHNLRRIARERNNPKPHTSINTCSMKTQT